MAKRMTTARKAAVLGLAGVMVLAGTAQAAPKAKRWSELLQIKPPGGTEDNSAEKRLKPQLQAAADIGNKYLDRWIGNREWDKATGGLLLLSGFYGAAVTAFNPAPKNLKAAILASGTAAGLNTGLKFRGRGAAYRQGHHAMACLVETGAPLMFYEDDQLPKLESLRQTAADALATGDLALVEAAKAKVAPAKPGKGLQAKVDALIERLDKQASDDERKTLEERMKVLADLDRTLAKEKGAYDGAGERVAQVRRQIQEATDNSLDAAAPDYAAAVKAMGETAQPEAGPPGAASAGGGAPAAGLKFMAGGGLTPPSITQALAEVNAAIRRLEAGSPIQATEAFKAMGECIPKAG